MQTIKISICNKNLFTSTVSLFEGESKFEKFESIKKNFDTEAHGLLAVHGLSNDRLKTEEILRHKSSFKQVK